MVDQVVSASDPRGPRPLPANQHPTNLTPTGCPKSPLSSATTVCLSLYLFSVTGSAQVLATVLAASMLASIYASPLVGGIADHLPKRVVLLAGNLILGALILATGVAALSYAERAWLLYLMILISGAIDAVIVITQQAAIRGLATRTNLVRVNAFVAFSLNAPLILGPALGALLYGVLPFWIIIVIDAVSFASAGCAALLLPLNQPQARSTSWVRVPFAGAREGFRLLWTSPSARSAQLWYSLANAGNGLGAGIVSAFILVTAGNGKAALGAFGSGGAIGVVVATLFLTVVPLRGSRARLVVLGLVLAALLGRAPLLGLSWFDAAVIVGPDFHNFG
ncbi:MFS transporter [Brevibacterium otitidis]|uniref:MFS transporter n=1 Tax=Brevibacterium otitidis TaxID=53364 RepID=A0ABV5X4P0_9MICO